MAELAGICVELWEKYDGKGVVGKGVVGRPMVANGSWIKVKIEAGE